MLFRSSRQHSLANVRMEPEQMVEQVRRCVELRGKLGPEIEAGVSTAFGCTMQGEVPEDDVVRLAVMLAESGADCVALADTVGYANPAQIRRVFRRVKQEIGDKLEAAHLHNTRGLGLANALAAYEEGVRHFDSSLGGLGGCPFAPGATGNVATEELLFLFERSGIRTGVDLDAVIAANKWFATVLGRPLASSVGKAGGFAAR